MYVIVTDFNGYAQTRRCLEALSASRFRDFTVLVVDHGTIDESRAGLVAEFPEVIRISGSPELWWTGATNLGIRAALDRGADRVMLLNNDCYVTPEAIGMLVDRRSRTRKPSAPVQRDWHSGQVTCISPQSWFLIGFPTLGGPTRLTPAMTAKALLPVKLIVGGRGVIIPSSVFTLLGLFDEEQLPHYGSDHDFYLRARRHGIPLYVATRAFVNIDNTRTTLADNPGTLSPAEFLHSLRSIRSTGICGMLAPCSASTTRYRALSAWGSALYWTLRDGLFDQENTVSSGGQTETGTRLLDHHALIGRQTETELFQMRETLLNFLVDFRQDFQEPACRGQHELQPTNRSVVVSG